MRSGQKRLGCEPGPNTKKLVHQFPPAMRVGVGPQHRETDNSVSTSTASWGGTTKPFCSN
ncbi:hypothetical protein [Staphylococcus marylandisciuri]|uniref:hypothetical protein n=1 Tax=Staphylococcus marylandisciuri TaxID=2981529 RepID=UPI0021D1779F|nr:hypothetical protein [Staphylococcus marylandisciuri]